MIKISKAATNIQPSLTRKLFNMAKEYENVIDFTLGDPDIPTPTPIKEAGCKAIMENKTRYSQNAGLIDLRQAIANYIFKKEQLTYSPENEILVSVGAMEGLYLSLLATIDSGDEVIIPAPYYVNYKQMVEMCGGVPIIVEDYDHIKEFKCSVNKIKEAITPKTVAIILNTPCNPTGKVFSQEFISQIAEVSKEKNLMVITDEVYKSLVYNGNMRPKSIASLPDMKERTIFINSLSKELCMTGWRIGYVAANREIITAMTKLQENVAACAPLPSQYAAIEALRTDVDYSIEMATVFKNRRDVLMETLSHTKKIKPATVDATFYAMIDISKTDMKSEEFAYELLKRKQVAVVPGIAYGKICDDFIRIAFTLDESKIREGMNRLVTFVEELN